MAIEDTKTTTEIGSSRELNQYLQSGWTLILSYTKHEHDTQEPCFVIGWQNDDEPVYPELLDRWERQEMMKDTGSLG
ncbi:MAG: hypothetical protein HKN25_13010 [Pyrinomonadaceae bacterium]|nr:hypothetical protein [Pyrinomonadaceae bacterium]